MKKTVCILLSVLMLLAALPLAGHAAEIVASGNCGAEGDGSNLTWTLDDAGTLTVSGSGTMKNYVPWNGNPAQWGTSVKKAVLQTGVTSIGDSAFYGCTGLTSVTIPDSVTDIGSSAFYGCTGLTSVIIGNGVTSIGGDAFEGCTGIETMTVSAGNPVYCSQNNCIIEKDTKTLIAGCKTSAIPTDGSITSIGEEAFYGCTGLTSVTIPDSVTGIGDWAFCNCTGLTAVTIPDSVTSIGGGAFLNCTGLTSVTVPDSVTELGGGAFNGCSNLVSVHLSNNITEIYDFTFYRCAALRNINLPEGITLIGMVAFNGCKSLAELTLPKSLVSVYTAAFSGCSGLKRLTFPEGIDGFSEMAFSGCSGLTELNLPNSLKSLSPQLFARCTGLTSLYIPDNVERIYGNAFSNCTRLETVEVSSENNVFFSAGNCVINKETKELVFGLKNSVIPSDGSVQGIGSYAFCTTNELTDIVIPEGVLRLAYCAFENNKELQTITLPVSVTEIGDNAIPEHTVIYGYAGSYAQQWAEEYNRAFVPMGDAAVTLNAPEVVNEPSVNVCGFANPGADVVCSVNGTAAVTAQATANGRWNAELPLTGAKDGDSFTLKATVTVDGKTAEQTATVTYKPDAIVFEEFTLNHSCYSVTVKGERLGVSMPNFTFVPGKPLAFKIKVTNNDRIDKLYIVSTKAGDSKQMALTYDANSGYWFANGFFDEADKNYVPGVFTIKGVDKDGKEFDAGVTVKINFLIDPSGYAYEGVLSNKLEDVTAAVYYKDKDGHELLWNAETADQINPITTLADGAFAWVVPEGEWQVRLTKNGYKEARSEWLPVPPIQENVYIPMVSQNAPEVAFCSVYADRAEITFSQYMNIESVNADNVTFEGYTGTIVPVDKTETADGSGVFYAKTFTFTPEKAFAGEIKATVSGAKNYADKAMAAPYTATFTVAAEPKNLTVTQDVIVKYGETAEIAVSAENAAGKTVSVACDSANVTLSVRTLTLDETGKATLTVTGAMPGMANLTFALAGTTLKAATTVSVTLPEPEAPAFALGDVDGNGKVESSDARLALRASVQLTNEPTDVRKGTVGYTAADYDGNGKVEASDARCILRVSVNLDPFG